MGRYDRIVGNALVEWGLDRGGVHRARSRLLADARGEILEIGIGTGLNLPNYPASVARVTGISLERAIDDRAAGRASARGMEVEHIKGDGQELPFDDASFDTVVGTFLLCSIPDPHRAVREFVRVLRPGGSFLFLEHIIARPGLGRRVQRLFEPVTHRLTGGCSLLRDTRSVIERNGFRIEAIEEDHLPAMPLLYRRIIRGLARPRG